MALGYQNPFYLKQAQKKQQSLYDGKVLLKKHDPPVVHDSEETLQLAQESCDKMKQMNKEIKLANYTKINHLSGVFVPQKALSHEELYFSNNSKTANVSKSFLIPNEDLLDDTTPSVARKFLNEVKSTILTLQRVVKQRTTIKTHNWASSAHQELHKIVRDENFPIVNQVDARLQNFEIQFLKEAAKFVGDFKYLANEADASFAKHKVLELEITRLLKAVVSQDIMIIVQNESVVDTSDLQTELERMKERFKNCIIIKETKYAKLWNDWYKKCDECKYHKISYDKAYKDMKQKIERLHAQLGDLKGKSKDTSCVSDTQNPLSQKLENKNVELEFQVLNYARENAYLMATYKNLFDSISVSCAQTKTIISSLQNELQSNIYKNANLRTQLFKKVFDQKDNTHDSSVNTKFVKQPIVENLPKGGKTNALSKPVTSNSVSTPQEPKSVNNDKVIAQECLGLILLRLLGKRSKCLTLVQVSKNIFILLPNKAGEGNVQQYVLFPLWSSGSKDPQNTNADTTFEVKESESEVHVSPSSSAKTKKHDDKTNKKAKGKSHVELSTRVRNLSEEFKDFTDNSINGVNAASTLVPVVGQNSTNSTNAFSAASPSNTVVSPTVGKSSYVDHYPYLDDPDMPDLEDITYSDDEEDVYVDDIIFVSTNKDLCKAFDKLMKDKFQMSLMGELTFFLGLQLKQKQDRIFISQVKYVAKILKKFSLTNGKSASTPIDTKKPLLKDPDGEDVDVHTYRLLKAVLSYWNRLCMLQMYPVLIEWLQAQLGDLKGKSKDTSCVSNTLNPLSQKLENENVELEFQILNYAKENAHLKNTYKNLFDSVSLIRTQTKTIIASLQMELQNTIYENAKLRAQVFKKVSVQMDKCGTSTNTKFPKQSILGKPPKLNEIHALSKSVTSNSIPTPQESKVMKNDKMIAPGMFRINPFKTSREEKHVPNTVRASARKKPITVSQPSVITKKDVKSDSNGLSST
nr:hypothetical protein [Tanacetum cinerariifolium]